MKELMAAAGISPEKCTSEDMAFMLAPMINAAGRLASPMIAFELFDAPTRESAVARAKELQVLNEERKRLQERTLDEARQLAGAIPEAQGLLLYSPDWHAGIVGIIAGHLAEKLRMPSFCFCQTGKRIVGSARSIPGVNLKEVMDSCGDLFVRYGGHEQAAGGELKPEALPEAGQRFNEAVGRYLKTHNVEIGVVDYDIQIDSAMARRLDGNFCRRLEALEPFGQGNERPLFRMDGLKCENVYEWRSGKGGFVKFADLDMPCHASVPGIKEKLSHRRVDVLFTIGRNFVAETGDYAIKICHARPASAS